MDLSHRVHSFVRLGEKINALAPEEIDTVAARAQSYNTWFTRDNVELALEGVAHYLQKEPLEKWLSAYNISNRASRNVGVVMAGNIPLAGFHDFLTVLLSGHNLQAKLSRQDPFLLPHLAGWLADIAPDWKKYIHFVEKLSEIDGVIATGSDNSARYFHYYFSKVPHIIRKNRTSVAVLSGEENTADIQQLGKDIFQYYGLGCRNVAKVFVPENYDLQQLLETLAPFHPVMDHHKYVNNYDYNKSIYLVNRDDHLDNGFLLLKESKELVSPVAVLYYERYQDPVALQQEIGAVKDKIQCIVSGAGRFPGSIPLGRAQVPAVWDYADGVDTMKFLLNLK